MSALLLCLFLLFAYRYGQALGWTLLLVAWVAWFSLFMGVIWLAEWFWTPTQQARERLQQQTDILKALEERAEEDNTT